MGKINVTELIDSVFFVTPEQSRRTLDCCVLIIAGEQGYCVLDLKLMDYYNAVCGWSFDTSDPVAFCQKANSLLGYNEEQIAAAITCSMFGSWANYENIANGFSDKKREATR